jgi:hypothetical protein
MTPKRAVLLTHLNSNYIVEQILEKHADLVISQRANEAEVFLVVAPTKEEAATLISQPVVCPRCGGTPEIIEVTLRRNGRRVKLKPAPINEKGFVVIPSVPLSDQVEDWSTSDEIARCPACGFKEPLESFPFYLAQNNAPVIVIIGQERTNYPGLDCARKALHPE